MEKEAKAKKYNYKSLLFYLTVVVIFTAAFANAKNWLSGSYGADSNSANGTPINQPETANFEALTQVNGDPNTGMEVTAIYEKEKSQNQTAFKISFNTHVVDFSAYDFKKNIVLRDKDNKEFKALSLSKEGSGHHQAIEIIFPETIFSPFKLAVKNLAGVPERVFSW